ncbi:MAG TPA: helix-turn-helix domain-containing protein [Acetobacteraceae bacterium]|nr:helix-turn-helix domain-containing protein [Acetobacteraceae bacterium]
MSHGHEANGARAAAGGAGEWLGSARDALGDVPWLRAVSAPMLDALAEQAILHRVPAGSILFDQSEIPAAAQLLIRGAVELIGVRNRTEMLVEVIRPADLLLPAAVLNRQPYLLRARVLKEAQLLILRADALRRAAAADHSLALALVACQAAQFRRQVKQAKNLKLRSGEERVGHYLLALAEERAAGEPVRLPQEKRLIASQLGMERETFSRILAAMPRYGIRVEGQIVIVENLATARSRFPSDPLIDGAEPVMPLAALRGA